MDRGAHEVSIGSEVPLLHASQRIGLGRLASGMVRRRRAYRDRQVLVDPVAHRDLAVHGFHVAAATVPLDAIAALIEGARRWERAAGAPTDGRFRSSYGDLHQPAGRAARACVIEHLLPALRAQLTADAFLRPSVFQVKPAAPQSGLRLHQDRALVDEQRSFTLHGWVALTDVTLADGPLVVLPGSHRFGAWSRVPAETDPLADYQEAMERHAVALEVRAGQVVWFDAALVHGSLVNRGSATRLGVSAVVSHRADHLAIAGEPIEPGGRTATVHEVDPLGTVRVDPPPLQDGPVVGTTERDELRFRPSSMGAVAGVYRALHKRPAGVVLPAGATCLS